MPTQYMGTGRSIQHSGSISLLEKDFPLGSERFLAYCKELHIWDECCRVFRGRPAKLARAISSHYPVSGRVRAFHELKDRKNSVGFLLLRFFVGLTVMISSRERAEATVVVSKAVAFDKTIEDLCRKEIQPRKC